MEGEEDELQGGWKVGRQGSVTDKASRGGSVALLCCRSTKGGVAW